MPGLPLAAPCEPRGWSISAASVPPMAAMLCEHQPGLRVSHGCWGLSPAPRRGFVHPSPLVMAMKPHPEERSSKQRVLGPEEGGARGLGWVCRGARSAGKRDAAEPSPGEMCLRTGNLAACRGAHRCSADSQWQQHEGRSRRCCGAVQQSAGLLGASTEQACQERFSFQSCRQQS